MARQSLSKLIRELESGLPRGLGILFRQRHDVVRDLLNNGVMRRGGIRQQHQIRIQFGGGLRARASDK